MNLMAALRAKTIEPVKRNKDGVRWIRHRFPIKGGISEIDAINKDFSQQKNPIWEKLVNKGQKQ